MMPQQQSFIPAQRPFWAAVVGVTFENRQAALAALYRAQSNGVPLQARIAREPDNAHDGNAIRVDGAGGPLVPYWQIGYLPKALAARLAPVMDAGMAWRVSDLLVLAGGDPARPGYGARVEIEVAEEGK